jgi:hypothetical protein
MFPFFSSNHKYLNYLELGVSKRSVEYLRKRARFKGTDRRYELNVKAMAIKYLLSYLTNDARRWLLSRKPRNNGRDRYLVQNTVIM